MLKTFAVALVILVSAHAFAGDETTVTGDVVIQMPAKPETCMVQILKALDIPDSAIPNMETDWGIPTDEFTDVSVIAPLPDKIIIATMRCYAESLHRTMERVY